MVPAHPTETCSSSANVSLLWLTSELGSRVSVTLCLKVPKEVVVSFPSDIPCVCSYICEYLSTPHSRDDVHAEQPVPKNARHKVTVATLATLLGQASDSALGMGSQVHLFLLVCPGCTKIHPASAFSHGDFSGSHHQPWVMRGRNPPNQCLKPTSQGIPPPCPCAQQGVEASQGTSSLCTGLLSEHCPSTLAFRESRVTYYLPHCSSSLCTPCHTQRSLSHAR